MIAAGLAISDDRLPVVVEERIVMWQEKNGQGASISLDSSVAARE
jgi:hypothetical protein